METIVCGAFRPLIWILTLKKKHPPGKGGDETRGADPDATMLHKEVQQCHTLSTANNISIKTFRGKEKTKKRAFFLTFFKNFRFFSKISLPGRPFQENYCSFLVYFKS
jgi:hypothetical protein